MRRALRSLARPETVPGTPHRPLLDEPLVRCEPLPLGMRAAPAVIHPADSTADRLPSASLSLPLFSIFPARFAATVAR